MSSSSSTSQSSETSLVTSPAAPSSLPSGASTTYGQSVSTNSLSAPPSEGSTSNSAGLTSHTVSSAPYPAGNATSSSVETGASGQGQTYTTPSTSILESSTLSYGQSPSYPASATSIPLSKSSPETPGATGPSSWGDGSSTMGSATGSYVPPTSTALPNPTVSNITDTGVPATGSLTITSSVGSTSPFPNITSSSSVNTTFLSRSQNYTSFSVTATAGTFTGSVSPLPATGSESGSRRSSPFPFTIPNSASLNGTPVGPGTGSYSSQPTTEPAMTSAPFPISNATTTRGSTGSVPFPSPTSQVNGSTTGPNSGSPLPNPSGQGIPTIPGSPGSPLSSVGTSTMELTSSYTPYPLGNATTSRSFGTVSVSNTITGSETTASSESPSINGSGSELATSTVAPPFPLPNITFSATPTGTAPLVPSSRGMTSAPPGSSITSPASTEMSGFFNSSTSTNQFISGTGFSNPSPGTETSSTAAPFPIGNSTTTWTGSTGTAISSPNGQATRSNITSTTPASGISAVPPITTSPVGSGTPNSNVSSSLAPFPITNGTNQPTIFSTGVSVSSTETGPTPSFGSSEVNTISTAPYPLTNTTGGPGGPGGQTAVPTGGISGTAPLNTGFSAPLTSEITSSESQPPFPLSNITASNAGPTGSSGHITAPSGSSLTASSATEISAPESNPAGQTVPVSSKPLPPFPAANSSIASPGPTGTGNTAPGTIRPTVVPPFTMSNSTRLTPGPSVGITGVTPTGSGTLNIPSSSLEPVTAPFPYPNSTVLPGGPSGASGSIATQPNAISGTGVPGTQTNSTFPVVSGPAGQTASNSATSRNITTSAYHPTGTGVPSGTAPTQPASFTVPSAPYPLSNSTALAGTSVYQSGGVSPTVPLSGESGAWSFSTTASIGLVPSTSGVPSTTAPYPLSNITETTGLAGSTGGMPGTAFPSNTSIPVPSSIGTSNPITWTASGSPPFTVLNSTTMRNPTQPLHSSSSLAPFPISNATGISNPTSPSGTGSAATKTSSNVASTGSNSEASGPTSTPLVSIPFPVSNTTGIMGPTASPGIPSGQGIPSGSSVSLGTGTQAPTPPVITSGEPPFPTVNTTATAFGSSSILSTGVSEATGSAVFTSAPFPLSNGTTTPWPTGTVTNPASSLGPELSSITTAESSGSSLESATGSVPYPQSNVTVTTTGGTGIVPLTTGSTSVSAELSSTSLPLLGSSTTAPYPLSNLTATLGPTGTSGPSPATNTESAIPTGPGGQTVGPQPGQTSPGVVSSTTSIYMDTTCSEETPSTTTQQISTTCSETETASSITTEVTPYPLSNSSILWTGDTTCTESWTYPSVSTPSTLVTSCAPWNTTNSCNETTVSSTLSSSCTESIWGKFLLSHY